MSIFDLHLPENVERDIHHIAQDLDALKSEFREIASLLRLFVVGIPTKGLRITQLIGGKDMSVTGVPLGGSGTFRVSPVPSNGQLSSVPQWTTGDASVTLAPAADGLTCVATVASTETLTSFGLTVSAVSSDGAQLSQTTSVPVLAATPVPATGLQIDQIA